MSVRAFSIYPPHDFLRRGPLDAETASGRPRTRESVAERSSGDCSSHESLAERSSGDCSSHESLAERSSGECSSHESPAERSSGECSSHESLAERSSGECSIHEHPHPCHPDARGRPHPHRAPGRARRRARAGRGRARPLAGDPRLSSTSSTAEIITRSCAISKTPPASWRAGSSNHRTSSRWATAATAPSTSSPSWRGPRCAHGRV
jgi:hypothetical protein